MSLRAELPAIIVGAGLMGRWHAQAVHAIGCRIAAVVDPDGGRAGRLSARYTGSAVYSTPAPALEAHPGAIVHVCTPLATHFDLIRAALKAGSHVIAEKPLAATASETDELLQVAAGAGRLLCPVHQFPFMRGFRRATSVLSTIGPIQHVEHTAYSAGAEGHDDTVRDAIALDIIPHSFSLIPKIFGELPDAIAWNIGRPAAGELRLYGTVGAGTVAVVISMNARPTVNRCVIAGDGGTVHVNLFHGTCVVESSRVSRLNKIVQPFSLSAKTLWESTVNLAGRAARREPAYPGLRELVSEFYRAAGDGTAPPISPEEARSIARARDAVSSAVR